MIVISQVELDDLEELSNLYEELSGSKTDSGKMLENFKWMKSNPDYIVLGAKYGRKLVGTLMGIICHDIVGACRPFMVIENVVVDSRMRGKGVGKELLYKIEEMGRERNCYYTMFVSNAQRKEAHKFYESVGYSLDLVQGFKKYL
ncbi:MAG: GNAT family N-acetyltransferase [Clostridia bacterium]|nr:GNAT family N-acetyltransferase [Clostridia bacterium]